MIAVTTASVKSLWKLTLGKIAWILLLLLMTKTSSLSNRQFDYSWVQGWRSGESTRLPPMWPGFDSQIRRHMWVEFVGGLLGTERFSLCTPGSPLLRKNQTGI